MKIFDKTKIKKIRLETSVCSKTKEKNDTAIKMFGKLTGSQTRDYLAMFGGQQ